MCELIHTRPEIPVVLESLCDLLLRPPVGCNGDRSCHKKSLIATLSFKLVTKTLQTTGRVGEGPLGNEIDWTPVVANEAVRMLTQAGVNAVKETAHIKVTEQQYRCKLAIFVHFDAPDSGESGPSLGYDHDSDADAADEWKTLYKVFFPFNDTWLRDNATVDVACTRFG